LTRMLKQRQDAVDDHHAGRRLLEDKVRWNTCWSDLLKLSTVCIFGYSGGDKTLPPSASFSNRKIALLLFCCFVGTCSPSTPHQGNPS
jgi:hypothetical protein